MREPSSMPDLRSPMPWFPDVSLMREALALYGVRVLDNVDLSRLPDDEARVPVVARALMERGDARAFRLGRRLLEGAPPGTWTDGRAWP